MLKVNKKIIIGIGYESSYIVQKAETKIKKYCMTFSEVIYPKHRDLLQYENTKELILEDDFWWCGEDIFENLKEPVFKNLLKNKKKIIIAASKIGQKEAGFINALIKFAEDINVTLILNKNQIEDSLYNHFMRLCNVVDVFNTAEFREKIYDENFSIKQHTSILEMEALLNMSFMEQIKAAAN